MTELNKYNSISKYYGIYDYGENNHLTNKFQISYMLN